VQAYGVGQQTIERGKMASIIPFTMELLEANLVADLESELRLAMVEAAAVRLDNTFFSNVASVTRVHPAGILNNVTAGTGVAGGGIDAVSGDVQAMYNKLTAARLGARPVLIVNSTDRMAAGFLRTTLGDLAFRDELASGTIMGIPVIDGPTIPQHTAIMVDAAYIGFGLDTPMFSMSTEASIVALNADGTDPTMAGARADGALGGNTAGTVAATAGVDLHTAAAAAAPAYSFWQTYSGGLRLIQFGGWAPIAAGAVQATNTTTWS
jgi:HK97 family phage major capsid protein